MRVRIAVFNHLLGQQPALRAELARHAGRRVGVVLPPAALTGVVTDQGWLAACEGQPEAVIRLRHGAALSALQGKEAALGDVTIEGDAELGMAVGRLLARLQWDAVEDLSRVVGDVAANRLQSVARGLLGIKGEIGWRLAESWIEHLREEAPMLAGRHQVESFIKNVDALRDDAARLDKRLARLEAALAGNKE